MRQDVAMILYKNNKIATKPFSGPLLEGHREGPGLTRAMPLAGMISTREYCNRGIKILLHVWSGSYINFKMPKHAATDSRQTDKQTKP
jgi:hypothetical protein